MRYILTLEIVLYLVRIFNLDDFFWRQYNQIMTEREQTHNWGKSIFVNGAILIIVLLCTHMVYETNDDFAISSRIVDGYPEVYFINYYYCLLLTKIQSCTTLLNVHVVAQVVLSYVSFVCILKLILDSSKERIVTIAACALLAYFSIDHYATIQFTKTAALITITGALLTIDALIKERSILYYIIGILLFLIGACIRVEGVTIAFGFAGIYAIAWMIDNRSDLKEFFFNKGLALGIVMIVIIGGTATLHIASMKANSRTPELEEYVEYNDLRTSVIDFSILNSYEKQRAEYDEAGLSETDISLIKSWMFDYDGAASSDNLKTIIRIGNQRTGNKMSAKKAVRQFVKGTWSSLKSLTPKGTQIIILVMMGIWLIVAGNRTVKFYVFLTGAAVVALHIVLYYIERPAYRAFYVPNICAAIFMIYELSEIGALSKFKRLPGILVIMMMLLLIMPVYRDATDTYNSNMNRIMSEEFVEYLNSNKDKFFVIGTREKKQNPYFILPWKRPDTGIESNCMGTGSWGTKSPYLFDKLAVYGLDNPVKDALYDPNTYYIGNKNIDKMTEYYNKWYSKEGKTVRMVKQMEVAGMNVWKPSYE